MTELAAKVTAKVGPVKAKFAGKVTFSDVDPPNALGMLTVQLRRGGKHEKEEGQTKPTYEVRDFYELRDILERDFGLSLHAAAGGSAPSPPIPPPEDEDDALAR